VRGLLPGSSCSDRSHRRDRCWQMQSDHAVGRVAYPLAAGKLQLNLKVRRRSICKLNR
jgi:hypothetical protein